MPLPNELDSQRTHENVRVIDSEIFSEETLHLLAEMIVRGQAAELVARLVLYEQSICQSDDEGVILAANKFRSIGIYGENPRMCFDDKPMAHRE